MLLRLDNKTLLVISCESDDERRCAFDVSGKLAAGYDGHGALVTFANIFVISSLE